MKIFIYLAATKIKHSTQKEREKEKREREREVAGEKYKNNAALKSI